MKLSKLLFCALLVLCLSSCLAVFVCAEDMFFEGQEPINFELKHVESITSSVEEREHTLPNMFDGDIYDVGLYSLGNTWSGLNGDYILITFNQDTPISEIVFWLTGNWTKAALECRDSLGNMVYQLDGKSDQTTIIAQSNNSTGGNAEPVTAFKKDIDEPYIMVKEIKLIITEVKWANDPSRRTFKVAEIGIKGIHLHNHNVPGENIIKAPTCALEGVRECFCCCGDVAGMPEPATGEHSMTEKLVYRNGYTNPGYKAIVCATCDTKDSEPTAEVGPLFTPLGYSAREDGSGAIQVGFLVNHQNIKRFSALSGTSVMFGVVAGSRETLKEGNPLVLDEGGLSVANSYVLKKDLSASSYDIVSYQITNFGESFYDTQLILAGYIYIGGAVSYIGEESSKDIIPVSYNGILQK